MRCESHRRNVRVPPVAPPPRSPPVGAPPSWPRASWQRRASWPRASWWRPSSPAGGVGWGPGCVARGGASAARAPRGAAGLRTREAGVCTLGAAVLGLAAAFLAAGCGRAECGGSAQAAPLSSGCPPQPPPQALRSHGCRCQAGDQRWRARGCPHLLGSGLLLLALLLGLGGGLRGGWASAQAAGWRGALRPLGLRRAALHSMPRGRRAAGDPCSPSWPPASWPRASSQPSSPPSAAGRQGGERAGAVATVAPWPRMFAPRHTAQGGGSCQLPRSARV